MLAQVNGIKMIYMALLLKRKPSLPAVLHHLLNYHLLFVLNRTQVCISSFSLHVQYVHIIFKRNNEKEKPKRALN